MNPFLHHSSRGYLLLVMALMGSVLPARAGQVKVIRTPSQGIQPQAATDANGTVHLLYFTGDPAGGDLYYVRRTPGAVEFSKPIKVNSRSGSAVALGTIRGAQLALGRNNRVHVAWNGRAPQGGSYLEAPMLYTRLKDDGSAFEPERNVITFAHGLDGGGSVAADNRGNVFVFWHAPSPGSTNGEAGRAVFLARSTDDGKTFAPESAVLPTPTGACACCGMRGFADHQGNLFALYRSAVQMTNRNEVLLLSRDHGSSFTSIYDHSWHIGSCPMSSAFLYESKEEVLAAAETHQRVFYVRVNPATGKVSAPVSPSVQAKHPVVAANDRGQVLLVWTEGTGWGKGGAVAWQIYGPDDQPISDTGRADGLPAWSLAAVFTQPGGEFVIVY